MIDISKKFWNSRLEYPPVIYNYTRRYLDLGFVLNHIHDDKSILDLGCGEGQLLLMMRELTDIRTYYGYDLSEVFINGLIRRWGNCPGLSTMVCDFTLNHELPKTDICVCMGVICYMIDNHIINMLNNMNSNTFICRVPCTFESSRITINTFSEEFKSDYAAVYRTVPEYISILSEYFDIESIDRCYPDEIESKYGTKQFYFVGRKKG